jgi:chromosome segregation ATPase
MNEPPLEKNESIIDIFVLSISESIAPQLTEPLEEKGYRVTLFSDDTRLLEVLREGKPNLLICDTTTVDEGFEVCRRIKADSDLWVIPVLVFTSASTLSDLLNVLDCNADNFLAFPADLPYRLSLIETMLTTPVERLTPELIKTQFKINHEDRIYVVSASRRKILELLLSSFEIAVNKSSDLSELKMEIQRLTEAAETLEESVTEHTCVIDLLNASIQQKEQKIIALTRESAEKERLIGQKTGENRKLADDLVAEKSRSAARDENLRTMIREKAEIESYHQSETDALRQQVLELSAQISTAKAGIDSVQREYEEAKTHCISVEGSLQDTVARKDLAEKNLQTLTAEHEELKAAFGDAKTHCISVEATLRDTVARKDLAEKNLQTLTAEHEELKAAFGETKTHCISVEATLQDTVARKDLAEKKLQTLTAEHEELKAAFSDKENRLISAEQEIQELRQARAQSDQEIVEKMGGLDRIIQQNTSDLARLEKERETEKNARISAEEQVNSLTQKYEQSESSLQTIIHDLNRQREALQAEFIISREALETKDNVIKLREKELAESVAEKEKFAELARAEQRRCDSGLDELNKALARQTALRAALEADLDEAKTQAKTRAEELALASGGRAESAEQVSSLTRELDRAKAALEMKESLINSLRENFAQAVLEKEKTEEQVKTDMESYKTTFIRLKRDLDETLVSRRTLEKDLVSAKTQNMAYAKELALSTRGKEQADQQVRLLAAELDQVKAELDAERLRSQASDEGREVVDQTRQRFEQDLRISADELASLTAKLENERKNRLLAEGKSDAAALEKERLEKELRAVIEERDHQEQDRAQKIQNLKRDLDSVCDLQKSLEEEVSTLNKEKMKAEEKVQALTLELDQARTALADEWEDHMTSDERLAAAVLERQRLQQSLSQADLSGNDREIIREIVAKEPDLPVRIEPASHALERVIHPEEKTVAVPADAGSSRESYADGELPGMDFRNPELSGSVSLSEEDKTMILPSRDSESLPGGDEEEFLSETGKSETGSDNPEYDDGGIYETGPGGGPEQLLPVTDYPGWSIPGPAFSINRQQWLSLIKWAHHSEALSRDQRLQIIRMGRLIQNNRRLTRDQEQQIQEMIALVQALGYRPV